MGKVWRAYLLRLLRRHLLWRAFRARHGLSKIADRTALIRPDDILLVCVLRNEALRLPYFLDYYRALGVGHFLIVDNDSTDGSDALLRDAEDVSLWQTSRSYKAAKFGMDWARWLLMRHGNGHWCLTVDTDELLTFDGIETRNLLDLTRFLDEIGQAAFGALMVELYPDGPLDRAPYVAGDDPRETLTHFDPGPYRAQRQSFRDNLWVQGGVRERVFFSDAPEQGPTLNKLPLVKWHWRYAYMNSTHSLLPPKLNHLYDGPRETRPCGALLHTKFLHCVVEKSREDRTRKQHFRQPEAFETYHNAVISAPNLMGPPSTRYEGTEQLIASGLMSRIEWDASGP